MVMIQSESLGQRAGAPPRPCDEPVVLETADDDTLLARLRAGDDAAFRLLVDRHRPWLVRLCTRLLGQDAHAAEDAAQESLLKLHRTALRDTRPLRVRPWLTVVARHTCVDEQRRRRPDLPGVLPERAAPRDDPFEVDVALAEAWSGLAGRHREVLYLREVLGFSYKEIAGVMGLTMPATETLVFRARGALRREYERSGGTSFGCGVLGFHLARLGLGGRRDSVMADGMSNAAFTDASFGSLTTRLAHFLTTALPGCGEQAIAKVLSVAAGVAVAAAAVIPGLGPFGGAPRAEAAAGASPVSRTGSGVELPVVRSAAPVGGAPARDEPATLRSWLGEAVPADWTPQRSRRDGPSPATPAAPPVLPSDPPPARITPLRDAAAARPAERPALQRPVRGDEAGGPLRSVLPARPDVERPERPQRPASPLRWLLSEPVPSLIDDVPLEEAPTVPDTDPAPGADPAPEPADPTPPPADPESRPKVRPIVSEEKGAVAPGDGNVERDDGPLVRRRHR